MFDAILGDPPYGVRAGGRKSAPKDVEIRNPDTHYVATAPYGLTECVDDLVDMAARLLRPGGWPGAVCFSRGGAGAQGATVRALMERGSENGVGG